MAQTRVVLLSLALAVTLDLISFGSTLDILRPDLALLVVLYWSTRSRSPANIGTGWCIGLLRDVATLTPLGLNAGVYGLTAWIGIALSKRLETAPFSGQLLLVLLTLLAGSMLSWGVGLLIDGSPSPQTHLAGPLIGMLCWPLVGLLMRNLSMRRRRSDR